MRQNKEPRFIRDAQYIHAIHPVEKRTSCSAYLQTEDGWEGTPVYAVSPSDTPCPRCVYIHPNRFKAQHAFDFDTLHDIGAEVWGMDWVTANRRAVDAAEYHGLSAEDHAAQITAIVFSLLDLLDNKQETLREVLRTRN